MYSRTGIAEGRVAGGGAGDFDAVSFECHVLMQFIWHFLCFRCISSYKKCIEN